MKNQQRLLELPARRDWKLDRKTIETGRRGVAQAREALREANERLLRQSDQAA
ncbi:MAG TPA: hypothetical protein VD926_06675 [Acidimicrobiales bacterium]|nr:hypothetical protein [Acidimicrobiales bacterium]